MIHRKKQLQVPIYKLNKKTIYVIGSPFSSKNEKSGGAISRVLQDRDPVQKHHAVIRDRLHYLHFSNVVLHSTRTGPTSTVLRPPTRSCKTQCPEKHRRSQCTEEHQWTQGWRRTCQVAMPASRGKNRLDYKR